jgi:hypothetical protein
MMLDSQKLRRLHWDVAVCLPCGTQRARRYEGRGVNRDAQQNGMIAKIALRLESTNEETGNAVLAVNGRDVQEHVNGPLPQEIHLTLPGKGRYRAFVTNLMSGGTPFVGCYRLSLESSRHAWKMLRSKRSAEK